MGGTMEQIVAPGIVTTFSIWPSLIAVMRLRRAHRRQIVLSAAFPRARHGRDHGPGGRHAHIE